MSASIHRLCRPGTGPGTPPPVNPCDAQGACVMDAHCHRRFQCITEQAESLRVGATLERCEEDALLNAQACQTFLCRLVLALAVSAGACALGLWLLWTHDDALRQALQHLNTLASRAFWHWASLAG